jgi:hypothetical protein
MQSKDKNFPVEVYSGMAWQAEMVKDLLENEGIEAFLNNEISGSLNLPWDGLGTVKVVVSNLDYDQAAKVVEDFENSEEGEEDQPDDEFEDEDEDEDEDF